MMAKYFRIGDGLFMKKKIRLNFQYTLRIYIIFKYEYKMSNKYGCY